MRRLALFVALTAAAFASPALAQYTATLPVTCNAAGTSCTSAISVSNPDGTSVGASSTAPVGTPGTSAITVQGSASGTPLPVSIFSLPMPTLNTPSVFATYGVAVTAAVASPAAVLKASSGNVYSISAVNGTTAGFLVLYDATAAPTSGTALTTSLLKFCFPVAALSGYDKVFGMPVPMAAGAVLLFSTSCTTYTAPATNPVILSGQAR